MTEPATYTSLDLFAGTGWGVASQNLGIEEFGVEIMKAAQETRAENGFNTIFSDVWTGLTDPDQVPDYNILIASPPCFIAGTPVLTQRGSISIEDVVEGDLVWTHRNRWRRVTATMSRTADTVQIGPIVSTPDHPFYTRDQVRTWDNSQRKSVWDVSEEPVEDSERWTHAGASKGKFFASPLNITHEGERYWEQVDARLAGRYVADGWTGRDGIMIAVGDGREEPEAGHWIVSQSGPSCRRFTLADHELADFLLTWFGKGAAQKTLPVWVLAAPEEWRTQFLAGYIAGDGTPTPSGWRANTVSQHLASQLRLLGLSLGYSGSVIPVKTPAQTTIEGRVVNQSDYYSVILNQNPSRYTRDKDGFRWTKQRKEPKFMGEAEVFDITVEEDHSFTAWGYVVHNCQSFSRAGKGAGRRALDEVLATIRAEAYKRPEQLQAISEEKGFDDKTALVLSPLAYVYRDRPKLIALEQVNSVLPVWEAYEEVLQELGYATWTGIINSEQYGVPQARRRAYLLAVRDHEGEITAPPATHSQYYPRNPTRLDEDVEKWISMAEGLGRSKKDTEALPEWAKTRPSTTIVGSFKPEIVAAPGWRKPGDGPRQNTPNSIEITHEEAARLQSYPDGFKWKGAKGKQWLQVGNAVPPKVAEAVLRHLLSYVD